MHDTTPDETTLSTETLRSMSGAERFALAWEMSVRVRESLLVRLRAEHPEWSEKRLRLELGHAAFGSDPLPSGLQELIDHTP